MNSKKIRLVSTSLILASMLLFASASLYAYYQFEMIGKILKAGLVDPLEAWSESSYIIWPCNSTHYAARNMSTLLVDFGPSTNASEIINNCVAYGTSILLKVGLYELDTPIYIKNDNPTRESGLSLEGELLSSETDAGYGVILRPTANFPTDAYMIDIDKAWWFTMEGITIRNLHLSTYGGGKAAVDVRGISVRQTQDTDLYQMGPLLIENIHMTYPFQGLRLDGQIFYATFRNIQIELAISGAVGNYGIYATKSNAVQIVGVQHCTFEDIKISGYDWYSYTHTLLYFDYLTYCQFTDILLSVGNMTGQVIYMGYAAVHNSFSSVMVMDIHGAGNGVIVFNGTNCRNNYFSPIYCADTITPDTTPVFKFIEGAGCNYIQWMPFAMTQWFINATGGNLTYSFLNKIEILPPNQGYWNDFAMNATLHLEGNVSLSGVGVENRGWANISHADWITHRLWNVTPNVIQLTCEVTGSHIVSVRDKNATHIQINLHTYAGADVNVDEPVYWEAYFTGY